MPLDSTSSFQSVVELFLLRYHGRASSIRNEDDGGLVQKDKSRNYQMLLSYGLDPEFRLSLTKEMGVDPMKKEWRQELGFVLALEMILSMKGQWLYNRIIPEEKQRELENIYPEVFGKGADGPSSSAAELLGAACSPMGNQDEDLQPLCSAIDVIFPEGFELSNALLALRRHGSFLNIEPGWMQELDGFQAQLASDMGQLLAKLGEKPEVDIDQAERLQRIGPSAELVFCIAYEAVLMRWFRSLEAEEQDKVLASGMVLGWEDAKLRSAIERRFEWSKDQVEGIRAVMDAAESYRQYGESDAALFIYQSLVEDRKVQDRERAEAHNRMAVIHREEGHNHQAFLEFQEAGIIWEWLGSKWEGAVTSAFVAEGYHSEGKRDKAKKYLEEAFSLISKASDGNDKMAKGYFYLAGCANALGRTDLEKMALKEGLVFAQSLEDGELFIELNDRLMAFPR